MVGRMAMVLRFVENLRYKFGNKTDTYKRLLEENDIDGEILWEMTTTKLEKVGIASLGHREFLYTKILELKRLAGPLRGPTKMEFEAAMRAQSKPSANPPKRIETPQHQHVGSQGAAAQEFRWKSIDKISWDQDGERNVNIYITLDGVGTVQKDDLKVRIGAQSLDVKIRSKRLHDLPRTFLLIIHTMFTLDLNGSNYLYELSDLYRAIATEESFWRVKKDMIQLKLQKKVDEFWPSLKSNTMEANMLQGIKDKKRQTDDEILQVMRCMYEEGDDSIKQTIAKAWAYASDNMSGRKEMPMQFPGIPHF
ncbi:hypothetical protein GUITHDRAFT_115097 [Guillardia theta CCMP2712]|uniref:CS domain-containing protein n=1 Tax=Guillardia theta (strain CCMP2712) TaxID=905079 RepID=L1IRB3_GUITC|nr:hypothetical protein GUITHDRAFT_115097 [Guillardia theta CCMP2712]EKX38768.1 hypothetical protein GUITHDRAFT_115097 [Guillardia theta CCMP2712]|eukprot:XP_005825748.1 hypothetical protein GUITHDRAFT_115097 [Guillardia theta CCMP2712]